MLLCKELYISIMDGKYDGWCYIYVDGEKGIKFTKCSDAIVPEWS